LTNAGGNPINATVTITAALYDAANGGTRRCHSVTPVNVTNGLFAMTINNCTTSDFNGDALWLGIQAAGEPEMTPRQEIFPVPYAMALRPGSIVKGADSYVWVPGNTLVKNASGDSTRWNIATNGSALIYSGNASGGQRTIYYPITLPGQLYGQDVTVDRLTIYYKTENGVNSYIDHTYLYVQTDADSGENIIASDTDRTSETADSYSFSPSLVLSDTQGIMGLYLSLNFANDSDYVQIGGIKLQLEHQ
jgi:hypothetical protein